MIPAKHFYMIRHGQTEANLNRIMAGSNDSPLTELGKQQARAIHNIFNLIEKKPKIIAHSHLSRAKETATIINEILGLELVEDAELAELHAGEWEGVSYDICRTLLHEWEDPPAGETYKSFFKRIRRAKQRILSAYEAPALIVSHGGVFRAFGGIYGLKTPGVFENCHLYEFLPSNDEIFPWDVFHYRFDENNQKLVKEEADVYKTSSASIIA